MLMFLMFHPVYASEITAKSVLVLVNKARQEKGLARLTENEKLDAAAQDKLKDMTEKKYFAHTSPAGIAPWYWFGKNNYDYKYAGENLAINFVTVENQHKAWMASPTHKKNILNSEFQEIGIAVGAGEINGETSIITVQEFGSRDDFTMPANQKDNFSGDSSENLIKDGEAIGPQVLSIKKVDNYLADQGKNNTPQNESKYLEKTETMLAKSIPPIDAALLILIMLSLFLLPMVFLAEAYTLILHSSRQRKYKENLSISAEEYLRVFSSHGKARKALLGLEMIEIRIS
jgi:hypothetical protein